MNKISVNSKIGRAEKQVWGGVSGRFTFTRDSLDYESEAASLHVRDLTTKPQHGGQKQKRNPSSQCTFINKK